MWDPTNHTAWANTLGLVPVPLFNQNRSAEVPGQYTVLLDGRTSSFALCSSESDPFGSNDPLSWSWSANLNHVLQIDDDQDIMYLRRWDTPDTVRRFQLPSRPEGAEKLLTILDKATLPTPGSDVIGHILRAFRYLRSSLVPADALESIRVFNTFLAGAEAVRAGRITETDWSACDTVGKVIELLEDSISAQTDAGNISNAVKRKNIGNLSRAFLHSSIGPTIRLEPDLLLRHASGQLYQEAHLIIERESPQLYLPGMGNERRQQGTIKRDVRFTPTSLARSLVQESFRIANESIFQQERIVILDPACGSGIFLQEALRELNSQEYRGEVILRGFDISPISCTMARFCIDRACADARSAGVNVNFEIKQTNSLTEDWGIPDIILMNPPFIDWQSLGTGQREMVDQILGTLRKGRADIAMAFVWKGVSALRRGSVLASVLPAAILDSGSGKDWREELARHSQLRLIGYFRGYGFFAGSAVEPAFILLQKTGEEESVRRPPVKILLSSEGAEDAALRFLRRNPNPQKENNSNSVEIYNVPASIIQAASWLPRSGKHQRVVATLASSGLPTVDDLFYVHQGIRTGMNEVYILYGLCELIKPDTLAYRTSVLVEVSKCT